MKLSELVVRGARRLRTDNLGVFLKRAWKVFGLESAGRSRDMRYNAIRRSAKDGLIVADIEGSRMFLNVADEGISKQLALDKIREPEATKMIWDSLVSGEVVVDIGANIGYFALIESQIVGESGCVYAIEPVPGNVELLRRNIDANNYTNIELFQMGISEKAGKVEMFISKKCNWSSMIFDEDNEVVDRIEVDVVTLDEFLVGKKDPTFIRMDVEGFEYEILNGMDKTLGKYPNLKFFIEIHAHLMGREKTIEFLERFKQKGYETTGVFHPELDFSYKTIDELITHEQFLSGEIYALHVFLQKKS